MNATRELFRIRDFRYLIAGRLSSAFGGQMLTFAVAWDLWIRTRSAFALGLVGLVEVVPIFLFALPAGVLADRKNRRTILLIAQSGAWFAAVGLTLLSLIHGPLLSIYFCLAVLGLARAFSDPASSAYIPLVVPPTEFTKAATWNSGAFQLAVITGPAFAGILVGLFKGAVTEVYGLAALLLGLQILWVSLIQARPVIHPTASRAWQSLVEGIRFLWSNKIVLSAITLDLFAVLFGGAVALLPIFATDILHVGPSGLGLLRSAPSLGALIVAFALTRMRPFRKAGPILLVCVAGFGLCTIGFGLSVWFPLSLFLLFLLGGFDSVSVVVRSTLMLTEVPDSMRGRTSAVNTVFISSSNELGDFESGLAASLVGPVAAVVAGGIGTLIVVAAVWRYFPQLKKLGRLGQSRA